MSDSNGYSNITIGKLNKLLSENTSALVGSIFLSLIIGATYYFIHGYEFYIKYSSIFNVIFALFFMLIILLIFNCIYCIIKYKIKKRKELRIINRLDENNDNIVEILSDLYEKINEINGREDDIEEKLSIIQNETRKIHLDSDLNNIKSTIDLLKRNYENLKIVNRQRNIQEKLEKELKYYFLNKIQNDIVNKFKNQFKMHVKSDLIRENKIRITNSIDENINKLDKFASRNLYIGLYFSTSSILFFVFSSFSYIPLELHNNYFIPNLVQKIIFIIGLQTIGFLFFRSYRNNITDRKYFLNERTNVEVIFSALESAILSSDAESEKKIYEKMSEIERNFLIKSGETTINIKQNEVDYDNDYKVLSLIMEAIKGAQDKIKK